MASLSHGSAKGKGMDSVFDKNGKIMRKIGRESGFEVIGYWNGYGYNMYKRKSFLGDLFDLD